MDELTARNSERDEMVRGVLVRRIADQREVEDLPGRPSVRAGAGSTGAGPAAGELGWAPTTSGPDARR